MTNWNWGVLNPSAIGLHVEGFVCTLYKMVWVEGGVYLPTEVLSFRLVEYRHDLLFVPKIVEAFNFVKAGKKVKTDEESKNNIIGRIQQIHGENYGKERKQSNNHAATIRHSFL